MLGPVDVSIFRWINISWAAPLLDTVFRFFSFAIELVSLRVALLIIVAAMLWRGSRSRPAGVLAVVAWPISNALSDVFKHTFQALRPYAELDGVRRLEDYSSTQPVWWSNAPIESVAFGTMSAHSANMAAVAMVMCLKLKWWGAPWVFIALLTGLSRVYVGAHYPSQVLLGWMGGALCGWIVVKTWETYQNRKSPGVTGALNEQV